MVSPERERPATVVTDDKLHAMKDGKALNNLYAAGTILADNDFNHYADHEGVDMLTALEAAKKYYYERKDSTFQHIRTRA